ncbi:TetR/AcrR family transcriptional regulator [Skermania piniformis]|uniref:TetR family transcriptional regulator n=1 Tax=Skermania pinensis TaxID=39122 RepID=A0ABX8SCY1_9ACTN|nr:TetR family transcriptional regulator [Skermania piniformis]QXQ13546.1 TetR family transcriptional regulator [Skermania piniformis]
MAERRAGRREQLLAAAHELLADGGGAAVSVRAVCRAASLTERYFYENFTNRDELVAAVFAAVEREVDATVQAAVAAAPPAAVAAAAVDAVVGLTIDQPDKGRILFLAPMTEPGLYVHVERVGRTLTERITAQLPSGSSAEHRALVATSLAGALSHLFHEYVAGRLEVGRDAFVAHCVQLLHALGGLPEPG